MRRDDSGLGGKPADDHEWDGVAVQWFADEAAYNAVYHGGPSPTRGDTLAHTSRFARLVVTEHEFTSHESGA